MKTFLLNLKPVLGLLIMAAFASCNSNSNTTATTDTTASDTSMAMTDTTTASAAFVPFDVVERAEKLKDYDKWRPFYDSMADVRKANGLEDMVVGRRTDNPNNVELVMKVTDMEKAKASLSDPKIKEAIKKSGVISTPVDNYWHIIRNTPHPEIKDWVEIKHKVKDFDAWLKVYDGEGTAQRQSEGMMDEVIGRGIKDSNLVLIVFDVTDMAKAKAAITSDAKKKLMTSAGVIGQPTIEFYTEGK